MGSLMGTTTFQETKKAYYNKSKSKKKQPMKVVYISNPMKFTISASQFRALVQELTGQDSELPEHDSATAGRFLDPDLDNNNNNNNQTVLDDSKNDDNDDDDEVEPTLDLIKDEKQQVDLLHTPSSESFDDIFMPQMLENHYSTGSSLLYESSAASKI